MTPERTVRGAATGTQIRLNIGCGIMAPEGWINIDASWNAWAAKIPGMRALLRKTGLVPERISRAPWSSKILIRRLPRRLPFPDGSVSAIYSSHFIEHLTRDEGRLFVRECRRLLREGGLIRLITPDLEQMARDYLTAGVNSGSSQPQASERFLQSLGLVQELEETTRFTRLYRRWRTLDLHKWLYDQHSLGQLLAVAGFRDISRRAYADSQIQGVQEVEQPDRLLGALCLEAQR